jgi:hypothetical protein
MFKSSIVFMAMVVISTLGFVYCGDGDGEDPVPGKKYTIGGTVENLQGPVNLRLRVLNEETDTFEAIEVLQLDEDGSFTFETKIEEDSEYEVEPGPAIAGDSFNANCPLAPNPVFINPEGVVHGNITNIRIECN